MMPPMRHRIHAIAVPLGGRRVRGRGPADLSGARPRVRAASRWPGECSPAVDVYETDEALEIVVDLPGVDAAAVRVLVKGETHPHRRRESDAPGPGESSFHLVERGFGRFARAVRLTPPCDASQGHAPR